jgi:hypothetical protein
MRSFEKSQLKIDGGRSMKILVVDVGGTHVKILATGHRAHREFSSGPAMTPEQMVSAVRKLAKDWKYDVVSIGYPGPVLQGKPVLEPHNLGRGWVGFDFENAFQRPWKALEAHNKKVGKQGGTQGASRQFNQQSDSVLLKTQARKFPSSKKESRCNSEWSVLEEWGQTWCGGFSGEATSAWYSTDRRSRSKN